MNEEENAKIEDIEVNNEYEVVKTKKEEFDDILAKIEKMSEAVELHENVKKAVTENKVDTKIY